MIWLTWRQSRAQIISVGAVVAVLAACMAAFATGALTGDPTTFLQQQEIEAINPALYIVGTIACLAAPPIIGAFWGAPLVAREIETGTFRLAWNQGVSRTRWLSVKLAGLITVAAAVTGTLSLALTWWASSIDAAIGRGGGAGVFAEPRIAPVVFSARGVVPAAYAVAAVAVGVLVGLVVRRTVAALALTLIAVVALQVVTPMFLREHLMAPQSTRTAITAENLSGLMIGGDPGKPGLGEVLDLRVNSTPPSAWEISNRTLDRAGRVQSTLPAWVANCGDDPATADLPGQNERRQACFTRLAAEGYQQEVRIQPVNRFWALQWRESALLLVVAAAAAGLSFIRLRR